MWKWKSLSHIWFFATPWILQARTLEWVAVPFSKGSSQPRDWTWSPSLQVDSLPAEPLGKPGDGKYRSEELQELKTKGPLVLSIMQSGWLNKLWEGESSREDYPGQSTSESNIWTFAFLSHGLSIDLRFIGLSHCTGYDSLLFWREKRKKKKNPIPFLQNKRKCKSSLGSLNRQL